MTTSVRYIACEAGHNGHDIESSMHLLYGDNPREEIAYLYGTTVDHIVDDDDGVSVSSPTGLRHIRIYAVAGLGLPV